MRQLFTLAAAVLLSTGSAYAQTAPQTPRDEHPFYSDALYPAWHTLTPAQALVDIRAAIALARERQAAIRDIKPEDATFENVFLAFEHMNEELDRAESLLGHLSSVMDNEELRTTQVELIPELTQYMTSITADTELWHVIKNASQAPWVKDLSPAKQRYVRQLVDYFHDSGADLSREEKQRLSEIMQESSHLAHEFEKRVLDSTNAWQWVVDDVNQLAGMSKDWIDRAAEDALNRGIGSKEDPRWLVTLDEPSAREVIWSCDVEESRKKCWEGLNYVCCNDPYDTADIVARIMELRSERAALLGFRNYADMNLAHRMAGSGDRAMSFIDDMMQKVKPVYDREMDELRDYISRCTGKKAELLNPWDIGYYIRKLAKERYKFDPETLRPYQEYSHVLQGMFSIFQELYDIRIEELPTHCFSPDSPTPEGSVEVWHPDVRAFAVYDNKTDAHLGSFYMDLFPRATKRAGAWVMPLHFGKPAHDGQPHEPHLAVLLGNLSPATGDRPALFSHRDVETIFHEFGHMMHALLGDTELSAHCGTSVAWDFVELPSQMNENWTWEPEGIAAYAKHYQTGEALPDEMIRKLQDSRFSFPATENMGQLCLAKLDMELHTHYESKFKGKNIDTATQELLAPWRTPLSVQAPSFIRTLSHCVSGGYAAGYYSYKWAEVLAADVFTRFENEGIRNPATGADYRDKILSKGDSKPASELYRDFMGRDPNPDALLQRQGLLKK